MEDGEISKLRAENDQMKMAIKKLFSHQAYRDSGPSQGEYRLWNAITALLWNWSITAKRSRERWPKDAEIEEFRTEETGLNETGQWEWTVRDSEEHRLPPDAATVDHLRRRFARQQGEADAKMMNEKERDE